MDVAGRVVVVTGGGNGIGRALCRRLAVDRPAQIIVVDRDVDRANLVADEVGGTAMRCDVADEAQVQSICRETKLRFGPIDVFYSNAGTTTKGGLESANADWQLQWNVNLMSHVYAARCVVPAMAERGLGAFIITSSAAGLLTEMGSAPYSATKHAAVAMAEWLSVEYRRRGVVVQCLCPAGVATDFLNLDDPIHQFLQDKSVTAEQAADATVAALADEKFLVLPHPEVREFFAFKGQDYDKWLHNFAHVKARLERRREQAKRQD